MRSYGEQIQELIARRRLFSVADAKENGIPASALAYYCRLGKIQRLCQGVYAPLEAESNPYPDVEQLGIGMLKKLVGGIGENQMKMPRQESDGLAVDAVERFSSMNIKKLVKVMIMHRESRNLCGNILPRPVIVSHALKILSIKNLHDIILHVINIRSRKLNSRANCIDYIKSGLIFHFMAFFYLEARV